MHTGYDNYWMYNNRRHEQVLCCPKNDSYSHPVFADGYKQVQGMENPNTMYHYIPPPNTMARPHQKVAKDQQRMTNSQSMWPTTMCLQPCTSLTHNFHPNEICSARPNNVYGSSQPLRGQVLQNVQNCNVHYNPVQSVNYKASADSTNNQHHCNFKTPAPRIRVKDISMLHRNSDDNPSNNNHIRTNNNCNALCNDLNQAQEKSQHYYSLDPAVMRHRRMYPSQTQGNHTTYNNTALPELNHSYLSYGHPASHQFSDNGEQYPQSSAAFYQQNAQITQERLARDNVQQMSEKSREAYLASLRKHLNQNGTLEANDRSIHQNSEEYSDSSACARNSLAFRPSNLPTSNEMSAPSQPQSALPTTIQTPLLSPTAPGTEASSEGCLRNLLTARDRNTYRVTGSLISQSSRSPNAARFPEPSRNSDLCERSLSPADIVEVNPETNEVETLEVRASFSTPQSVQPRDPVPGCERSEEKKNRAAESPADDRRPTTCKQPSRNETVAAAQNEEDCIIIPKEESVEAEKDNPEEEAVVCLDGDEIKAVKTEADYFTGGCSLERLSESKSLEKTELPDTKIPDTGDLVILKKPEPTSGKSHESEVLVVDIADKAKNDFEEVVIMEDVVSIQEAENEKPASPAEDKGKSEIDRDKLDLLIEFLKKDGGPVNVKKTEHDFSPPETAPQIEKSRMPNRRKLSKTCIVRNKNTEREMVSLMSYKALRNVAKSSPPPTETSENRNGFSESCHHLENDSKNTWNPKRPQENDDDPFDGKRQANSSSLEEETEDSLSDEKEEVTTEERNLINVMRAIQNLEKHFCASCNFTSPVDSVWINVVSGELRCLNCFKKMMLKADENVRSSKTRDADAENTLRPDNGKGSGRGAREEKNFEKRSKCEGVISAKAASKSEDLKEPARREVVDTCFDNATKGLEREGNIAENKIRGKDQCDSVKRQISDELIRSRDKHRSQKSSRTDNVEDKHRKREAKEGPDSQDRSRKRSNSAEEFVPRKVQILEKSTEDARQEKTPTREKPTHKSLPKENGASLKSHISEEFAKKIKKHDGSDRPKSTHSKEGSAEHRPLPTRKEDDILEKVKRQRASSEGEVYSKKSRSAEDCDRIKSKSSEKSRPYKEMREDVDKLKAVVERRKEEEAKDRLGTAKKSTELKEVFYGLGSFERELNKASEFDLLRRHKKKTFFSETTPSKVEASNLPCIPPKVTSKGREKPDETKWKYGGSDSRKPFLPQIPKKSSKQESFDCKNDEAAKSDRKERHCFDKRPEINPENDGFARLVDDSHDTKSKQCLISKLFKGKHSTRLSPTAKHADKGLEHTEHRRDIETKAGDPNRHHSAHSDPKTHNKSLDRRPPHRTHGETAHGKELPLPKDLPASPKSNNPDKDDIDSTDLLTRLMQKTKKLSWTLLGDP